jgi:hypothetical protein
MQTERGVPRKEDPLTGSAAEVVKASAAAAARRNSRVNAIDPVLPDKLLHPKKDYMYWKWEEMPKFYPILSLRLGLWQSQLNLPDQLFVMFQLDKIVFVVVHPPR